MAKLKPKQKAWLVAFHILFAGSWLGAGICLLVIIFTNNPTVDNANGIHAVNTLAKIIDDFVVIPMAVGSLLTGLGISWLTNWGFFRYKWVTIKWILTIATIIFGTFWLGPWLNGMEAISATEGLQAIYNATYLHNHQMLKTFGYIQLFSLVFMVFISVLKPWKKWQKGQTIPA
jgi:uncharacterized membrane protein